MQAALRAAKGFAHERSSTHVLMSFAWAAQEVDLRECFASAARAPPGLDLRYRLVAMTGHLPRHEVAMQSLGDGYWGFMNDEKPLQVFRDLDRLRAFLVREGIAPRLAQYEALGGAPSSRAGAGGCSVSGGSGNGGSRAGCGSSGSRGGGGDAAGIGAMGEGGPQACGRRLAPSANGTAPGVSRQTSCEVKSGILCPIPGQLFTLLCIRARP